MAIRLLTFPVKGHYASTAKCGKDIVVGRQRQEECEWNQPETECEVSHYLDKTRHKHRSVGEDKGHINRTRCGIVRDENLVFTSDSGQNLKIYLPPGLTPGVSGFSQLDSCRFLPKQANYCIRIS